MPATLAHTELESRSSDLKSKTYRARFDTEATTPSMAVVAGLAELRGTVPEELAPLQQSIETGALDRLIGDTRRGERSITFPVEAYTVTVRNDGSLRIDQSPQGHRHRSEGQQR